MLYKKNNGKKLDIEIFKNPTVEYRGAPFWAFNCKLDREQILRQIDYFKEMGFGGFHMHSRVGMATEYLSEEFMGHIKACVAKAKENGMLAWLYDEDKWASGAAGGYVTKEKKFRQKALLLTINNIKSTNNKAEAYNEGLPYFISAFDILLDSEGYLVDYKRIGEEDSAENQKWFAYVVTAADDPWFNNQSYPDTMDKETIEKFIDITYNTYNNAIGNEFNKTVPAIFTDEPNFAWDKKPVKKKALDREDQYIPWSRFYEEKYFEQYREDIVDSIPEIIWLKRNRSDAKIKYRYYDFCAECFAKSFADSCGEWCEKQEIALTGHVLYEDSLSAQAIAVGDNMRQYRSFTIPGIDMLCDEIHLTTAKQCQSVVHQMGKEAMLSELYGVTNWDFDFRGHKFQGDWQAALGVTVRVPHLSWMSMAGEAKRDYPASIFYQSPWYKKYSYIEDHYARLNTVLTRGKPIVRVGVIHPIESYWIQSGPNDQTGEKRKVLDDNFKSLANWLLSAHYDFDYINESLIPFFKNKNTSSIGEMKYDVIIVSDCISLRSSTLEFLKAFNKNGGRVIFTGEKPEFLDGEKSDFGNEIYNSSEHIVFNKSAIISALEKNREVDLRLDNGLSAEKYLYQMREDGEDKWLFIARFVKGNGITDHQAATIQKNPEGDNLEIEISGEYLPEIYDTLSGRVLAADYELKNVKTIIKKEMFESDSLLLKLSKETDKQAFCGTKKDFSKEIRFSGSFDYIREEANVLLLDMAEYRLDDEEFQEKEEILRLDNKIRQRLGYPMRRVKLAQPWVMPDDPPKHKVTLKYEIISDIDLSDAILALEDAEKAEITFNGNKIANKVIGWYVDEAIKTVALPEILKGKNILTVTLPFSLRSNLEAAYIVGAFGVKVQGSLAKIISLEEKIGFGSLTSQGMPFYGGNITYQLPFEISEDTDISVHLGKYKGAVCEVSLDDDNSQVIVFSPYDAVFENVKSGKHILKLKVFGNRYNTFGCLHNFADNFTWYGPDAWRTVGDYWGYEYNLKDTGMLTSPVIKF